MRVVITTKNLPKGQFLLDPMRAGALERDSGTTKVVWHDPRVVIRDGQSVDFYDPVVWTLKGKRGTLTIRERSGRFEPAASRLRAGAPIVRCLTLERGREHDERL